jgi:hypothetical protein
LGRERPITLASHVVGVRSMELLRRLMEFGGTEMPTR